MEREDWKQDAEVLQLKGDLNWVKHGELSRLSALIARCFALGQASVAGASAVAEASPAKREALEQSLRKELWDAITEYVVRRLVNNDQSAILSTRNMVDAVIDKIFSELEFGGVPADGAAVRDSERLDAVQAHGWFISPASNGTDEDTGISYLDLNSWEIEEYYNGHNTSSHIWNGTSVRDVIDKALRASSPSGATP